MIVMAAASAQGGEDYSILRTLTVCVILLAIAWALGTAARDPGDRDGRRRPGIDPRKLQESIDAHPSGQPAKQDSDR